MLVFFKKNPVWNNYTEIIDIAAYFDERIAIFWNYFC
jgi:hypothetical protein